MRNCVPAIAEVRLKAFALGDIALCKNLQQDEAQPEEATEIEIRDRQHL